MATNQTQPQDGKNLAGFSAELAMFKTDIVDLVCQKITQYRDKGELHLPENYSVENAQKSAWLKLQTTKDADKKLALNVCTKDSIANAILDMVIQGLNPAKDQCYFIAYGQTLVCQRSYFGTMAVAKMVEPRIKDISAQEVYKGDTFKYTIEKARKKVMSHVQDLENVNKEEIVAAYCTIEFKDGSEWSDIMTINEIKQSWAQGINYKEGGNGAHQKFTADMAKKTVVNRACKPIIKSSADKTLLRHFNRSGEIDAEIELETDIEENANTGPVIEAQAKVHNEDQPQNQPPKPPQNSQAEGDRGF